MRFRLFYQGELRPKQKQGLAPIHKIRKFLEPQLRDLWNHIPLNEHRAWLDGSNPNDLSARCDRGGRAFAAVISTGAYLRAELDILVMRPEVPGAIIATSGDIDNRVKTLLDALRVPTLSDTQKLDEQGLLGDDLFHCLLEDDGLVTSLNVTTDRLLAAPRGSRETLAIVNVRVRPSKVVIKNLGIVS